MMAQILRSSHRARQGEKVQMRPLLGLLRDAYAEHIDSLDREYGAWLNERGVD
jgi:hemerythrin